MLVARRSQGPPQPIQMVNGPQSPRRTIAKVKSALVRVQFSEDGKSQTKPVAGVLVDPGGLVVAPYVDPEKDICPEVVVVSGAKLAAKVLAADSKVGVTVLKVEAGKPFPHLQFADSDRVEVADSAVVLRCVDGYSSLSATLVLIGAKNRRLSSGEIRLQLDAAVSTRFGPGVLVDMNGSFLGVVPKDSGGVGLAVPSNRIKALVSKLSSQSKAE